MLNQDVFSNDWCEFIFDTRNKAYGAYELRKRYPKNLGLALLFTVGFFTFALSGPTIYRYFNPPVDEQIIIIDKGGVVLSDLPIPDVKIKQPEVKIHEQPPVKNTIEIVTPVIVDADVAGDETLPTQDDFKNADPGITTQAGDPNAVDPGLNTNTAVFTVTGNNDPVGPPPGVVEQMPEFIGGESAMLTFIIKRIDYPQQAVDYDIEGIAYINFIITKEGKVKDAKVVRGFDRLCDKEALRVIQAMPDWKPGKQNGRAVDVQLTLPVRFVLGN